jgi:hypothetical protein
MGRPSSGWRSVSSTPGHPAPHCRRRQGKAATIFQWGRPEPGCSSNTTPRDAGTIDIEGRRIQGELKNLLEDAAVRRAKSSASRRQGYPSEHHACEFPIRAGSLGPHRAHAQHGACGPGSPRQRAPPPRPSSPPRREGAPRLPPQAWGTLRQRGGPEPPTRTTQSIGFQPGHTTGAVPDPVPNPDYHHKVLGGRRGWNCGSRTTDWPASWVEWTMTTSSSATSPYSSPTPLEPGWSICLKGRSPTGMTWSKPLPATYRARTCSLGTPGISEAAASSRESLSRTTSSDSRSSALSCPTSPTRTSLACSSPAPRVRPGEQAGSQDPHQGERADGHRHQVRLWPRGG